MFVVVTKGTKHRIIKHLLFGSPSSGIPYVTPVLFHCPFLQMQMTGEGVSGLMLSALLHELMQAVPVCGLEMQRLMLSWMEDRKEESTLAPVGKAQRKCWAAFSPFS